MKRKQMKKLSVALGALVLAMMLPMAAMAEAATTATEATAATAAQTTTRGGRGYGKGTDISSLTDEQKATYEQALKLYEDVEDAVLNDLVASGAVAQADVDAYVQCRSDKKSLNELDQSGWTAEQYKAYYEANAKTGDERKAAMQALADAGQLTQEQANALSSTGTSDLWQKLLQNANTNSDIQTAMNTLRQASQTMSKTLKDAGIQGVGHAGFSGQYGVKNSKSTKSSTNSNGKSTQGNTNKGQMQNNGRGNRK